MNSKFIFNLADIIMTLLLSCAAIPIMVATISNMTNDVGNGFESLQEKTLLQTTAELDEMDRDYFTKYAAVGMYIVNQDADTSSRLRVKITYGGNSCEFVATSRTFDHASVPIAQSILNNATFKSFPATKIFRVRDWVNSTGERIGIEIYG